MRRLQLALGVTLAALSLVASAQTLPRKGYIIELADPPAASYEGTVPGLAATRPAAGSRLNVNASHVQAYIAYLDSKASSVASAIPSAPVYYRYGVAFNGFAAQLTDAELQKLLAHPGVKAITADEARQLDTSYTPKFLGINQPGGVWSQNDGLGRAIKGEDVIIAHIDGGVWPEDPSFSDKVDTVTGKPISLAPGRYRGLWPAAGEVDGHLPGRPGLHDRHVQQQAHRRPLLQHRLARQPYSGPGVVLRIHRLAA